jgi:hypothetical protein
MRQSLVGVQIEDVGVPEEVSKFAQLFEVSDHLASAPMDLNSLQLDSFAKALGQLVELKKVDFHGGSLGDGVLDARRIRSRHAGHDQIYIASLAEATPRQASDQPGSRARRQ